MPGKSLKLCSCGRVAEDGNRCGKCTYRQPRSTTEKGYDYQWRKLSERLREEKPFCEACYDYHAAVTRLRSMGVDWEPERNDGAPRASQETDHIVPVQDAPSLRLEEDNLMVLCKQHHTKKTAWEQRQGD